MINNVIIGRMRTEIEAARSATSGSQFASGILLDLSARRSTPRHATLRCAIAIATRYTAEERTAIYCNKCSGGAGFSLKKKKKNPRCYRSAIENNGDYSSRSLYYAVPWRTTMPFASMVARYWERSIDCDWCAGASTWPTIDFALALTRHAFIIRYGLM